MPGPSCFHPLYIYVQISCHDVMILDIHSTFSHHQLSTYLSFVFAAVKKQICHWSSSNSHLHPPHLSCLGLKAICIMPLTFSHLSRSKLNLTLFYATDESFDSCVHKTILTSESGVGATPTGTCLSKKTLILMCYVTLLFSLKMAQTSLTMLDNLRLNWNFHLILLATESCGPTEQCVWCGYKSATNLPGHETVLTEASIRQEK